MKKIELHIWEQICTQISFWRGEEKQLFWRSEEKEPFGYESDYF